LRNPKLNIQSKSNTVKDVKLNSLLEMTKAINNLKLLPKNIIETPSNSFQNLTSLVNFDLSEFQELTIIGYDNGKNLYSMQGLCLPPNINEIKSGSFQNCTSLMRLDLSDYDQLELVSFDCFVINLDTNYASLNSLSCFQY
jgi:hypothetical protein